MGLVVLSNSLTNTAYLSVDVGVSPVTIVGTHDVSGDSTTGNQVTIFCTGGCRNGDLAVTGDLNRVRETKVT
jgi:hypothetical protein